MLTLLRVYLPSDIPIVGCELSPYLLIRLPDGSITSDDIPVSAPVNGFFLKFRWFRIHSDKRFAVCHVHPTEPATLQCTGCIKAKTVSKSYHCSPECFTDSWRQHRTLHARAATAMEDNVPEEEDIYGNITNNNGGDLRFSNGSSVNALERRGGVETWYEVGWTRTYTPTSDDVGQLLKLECLTMEFSTRQAVAPPCTLLTKRVIPAPSPIPRQMIPINPMNELSSFGLDSDQSKTFSVLSYNVLADLYATSDLYSYCPSWALSWTYRKQNLLREILSYKVDILCLQEVQSDHFEEFFAPELQKHGYTAVYKRKTTEVFTGITYATDGCATFFRGDLFSLVKKYEVEFSKAAQSLAESAVPPSQRKAALGHLLKDNVALILVLEACDPHMGCDRDAPGQNQLICVANTHVDANPEYNDVKLWQVQILLKGLEKIAASADIPMLVCGGFNAVPGSALHHLLTSGRVEASHPDLASDPFGISHHLSRLCHQLPLASAYSSLGRVEGQKDLIDSTTNEPLFTRCTRECVDTIDYILYTHDSLEVESLLELLDEDNLQRDAALPSPEWSSDHIALLAQFRYTRNHLPNSIKQSG